MKNRYNVSFKEQFVRKELESFLDNMEFTPVRTLDESIIKDSGLFPRYDIYSGNDYISANYKNRYFVQSDIHLQEIYETTDTDSDGDTITRTKYKTIFQGRFMVFDYDTISNESVYIYDKRSRHVTGDLIQTELDAFNKRFDITAKDATAALRILTPQVIEGIALASDKLACPISLSFVNDKIYIAVSNGDAFEAATVGDATLSEQREQVKREIQAVLDMTETIYLKNKK